MSLNRLLFILIQILPLRRMHRKWKETIGFYVQKKLMKNRSGLTSNEKSD